MLRKYLELPYYHELITKSAEVYGTTSVSVEQAVKVGRSYKKTNSRKWFHHHAGRVTASRFKAAASTNVAQLSKSLIKQICYPESQQFKSSATW